METATEESRQGLESAEPTKIPPTSVGLPENESVPYSKEWEPETFTNASIIVDILTKSMGDAITTATADLEQTEIDFNLTTISVSVAKPKFSDMEIWFIATGCVILAVIVLFCINACIQCRVFEKLSKCFRLRNHAMVQNERRSHKDLEAKYNQDDKKTSTHLFLHKFLFRKQSEAEQS